jgi:asparagine synthase (glutamine-hydrolysing)
MSSIHALWTFNQTAKGIIPQMLSASDYWQPDNVSSWYNKSATTALAKAQLFNTKRSQADEVYCKESLKLTITANARIDNRSDLLKALSLKSEDVSTDSQLILAAYVYWGRECPKYLRGDFVFIIWDEEQHKIFCARDHFGVKVLFYSHNKQGIMLSNEHNAFFTSSWADNTQIDEAVLVHNLWGLGSKQFQSPCCDIKTLPPAHVLEIDAQGATLYKFWQLESKSDWQKLTDKELIAELKLRFKKAVEVRCDTIYPLGSELSEGLDSNGVAGYATRFIPDDKIYTFSYTCEALAEENCHVWADTYKDIEEMLALHPNLQPVWQLSQKNDKSSVVFKSNFIKHSGGVLGPRFGGNPRISLAETKEVRVLLSGWGGDHCVTNPGYNYADELAKKAKFCSLFQFYHARKKNRRASKSPLIATILCVFKNWLSAIYNKIQVNRGLGKAQQQQAKLHFLKLCWRKKYQLDKDLALFQKNYLRHTIKSKEHLELFELSLTNRLVMSELEGRQAKLEYRFPMLDVDLVEFAHNLPSRLKIYKGIERYPFREVLKGVTTERIRCRQKTDVELPKLDRMSDIRQRFEQVYKEATGCELFERYVNMTLLGKSGYIQSKQSLLALEYLQEVAKYYNNEDKH